MMEVWLAIDTSTNRVVGFGTQGEAQSTANEHSKLSGNKTILRKLRVGMVISGI